MLVLLCFGVALLTGCRMKDSGSRFVVNRITVTTEEAGILTRREFSAPENMRQILGVLRMLGQKSTPHMDPDQFQSRTFHIVLHHTDGSSHIICTKEDRFIRDGTGPWKQVASEGIAQLHLLLENLPAEENRQRIPKRFFTIADSFPVGFF